MNERKSVVTKGLISLMDTLERGSPYTIPLMMIVVVFGAVWHFVFDKLINDVLEKVGLR